MGSGKLIGRQEHALANSARVLRDALNNVPLLAVSLDREGCVTACNQHLLRLLGRPVEEVVGLKWQRALCRRRRAERRISSGGRNLQQNARNQARELFTRRRWVGAAGLLV